MATQRRPPLRWRVAHRFTSYSRQRGSEMARDGRVALEGREEASDRHALARVRDGPSLFVVRLDAVGRELHVACSCPVFALGREACRHVWAALVAIDRVSQRGHLARLRRTVARAPGELLTLAPSSQAVQAKESTSWERSSRARR